VKNIMLLIICFLLVNSCSTKSIPDKLNPDVIYKRDMTIVIDGVEKIGVAVVPMKDTHKIHITAQGDLDLFTFTTCHREETAENAWNVTGRSSGLFKRTIDKKREIKMEYTPTEIEKRGGCPIFLGGYEQEKGRHSWGAIDFETPEATLTARLSCNGEESTANGVSICQSREGLIQVIEFPTETKVLPSKGCEIGMEKAVTYSFSLVKGHCVYAFMEIATKKIHRLTTIGYELIPIRK